MKWLDDPPDDWDSAPEHPPPGRTDGGVLRVERLVRGVVIRDPNSPRAYLYSYGGSVPLADRA